MNQTIIIVGIGAIFAGFVQGLSGFGFGMVAMSFWAWTIDPKLAAVMTVFGALTGQLLAVLTVRRVFNFKQLLPFIAGGLLGLPIGVYLLTVIDRQLFKAFFGILLIIWCPAMLMSNHLLKINFKNPLLNHGSNAISGILGGISSGLGGFAGVFPTLWCSLRGFQKDEQRALIQSFNLTILFITFSTYIATGLVTTEVLPMFAIIVPAMLIPTLLGSKVYIKISDKAFHQIVLSLLTLSGVTLLLSSYKDLLALLI